VIDIPPDLVAYHRSQKALVCELNTRPWLCEFWPLDEVLTYNIEYQVPEFAPGYFGFATSGGGEMFALSPQGSVVCLAFIGMSPDEELPIAKSWREFENMLRNATAN